MTGSKNRWPLDDPQRGLREDAAAPKSAFTEGEERTEAYDLLATWQAPALTAQDTRELVARLLPYAPAPTPVRQALRSRSGGVWGEFTALLSLIRTQVSILRPSFWIVSAMVVGLGALILWAGPILNPAPLLQVIGPLLAYLGAANAFRGTGLHMLEFELACPPSPRQLTLARLIIILSYDVGLGLLLSLPLGSESQAGPWPITLHWLAPLLLGVGLTLLLSLRLPIHQAAGFAYTGWLAALVLALIAQNGSDAFSVPVELVLGSCGLAMIAFVLLSLPRCVSSLLPGR